MKKKDNLKKFLHVLRSQKKHFLIICFFQTVPFLFSACKQPPPSELLITASPGEIAASKDFILEETSGVWGEARHYSIREDSLELKRQESAERELVEIPVPAEFHTRAFRIMQPNQPDALVLRPHILVKSSVLGLKPYRVPRKNQKPDIPGEPHPEQEDEDQVMVHLSIALVNGLESEISTGKGKQAISESLLIPNKEAFLRQLGPNPEWVSQMKCPENVRFKIEGEAVEFPIELSSPLDSCPVNAYFPAQIKMNQSQWHKFQKGFLREGGIEITSEINLSVPIPKAFAEFQIRATQVERWLHEKNTQIFTPEAIEVLLSECVMDLQTAHHLHFEQTQFIAFKEEILKDFFQERTTGPEGVCYVLNPISAGVKRDYRVSAMGEEYSGRPIHFESSAFLMESESVVQPLFLKAGSRQPRGAQEGEVNRLLKTVEEGELVEIVITALEESVLNFPTPITTQVNARVCLHPYSLVQSGRWVYTRDLREEDLGAVVNSRIASWDSLERLPLRRRFEIYNHPEFFKEWAMIQFMTLYHHRPADALRIPDMPEPYHSEARAQQTKYLQSPRFQRVHAHLNEAFVNLCFRLPSFPFRLDQPFEYQMLLNEFPYLHWENTEILDNQCAPEDYQDQWVKTTTFGIPILQPTFVQKAITPGELERLLEGLTIQLRFNETTQSCLLKDLQPEILPNHHLFVHFRNFENCHLFDDHRDFKIPPILSIVNHHWTESTYPCGLMTHDWQGNRTYRCVQEDGTVITQHSTATEDEARRLRGEPMGIQKPFYSQMQVHGTLKSLGAVFENQPEKRGSA